MFCWTVIFFDASRRGIVSPWKSWNEVGKASSQIKGFSFSFISIKNFFLSNFIFTLKSFIFHQTQNTWNKEERKSPHQMIEAEIYGHKFMSNFASDWMMTGTSDKPSLMTGNHRKRIFWINLISASSKCWLRPVAPPTLYLLRSDIEAVQAEVGSDVSI